MSSLRALPESQILPLFVIEGIKRTLQHQQDALDNAIERGSVAMQWAIARRMRFLENALSKAEGGVS